MRRKSFISPCKEINTDQLFKRMHSRPANCKPPCSEDDTSLRYRKISSANTTSYSLQYFRHQLPKNTITSNSTKHADSGCLKISQLLGMRWESNSRSPSVKDPPQNHFRILKLTNITTNIDRSRSFARSTASKENYQLRPFTSGDLREDESVEESLRPATGALKVHIRMRTSIERIDKTITVEEQLPDQHQKIYMPKLWKRLKTLKGRRRRNRLSELDSVVVGIKAV